MTTIACDGKSMAGDGAAFVRGTRISWDSVKVCLMPGGVLMGSCGSDVDLTKFKRWLESGAHMEPPTLEEEFGALLLDPSGRVEIVSSSCIGQEAKAPIAIGSGMDLAIGAMDAGLSAEAAVEIASRRDPHTGGKITVLHLEPKLKEVA